jgi:phosphoribosylanthranilate isomerase
MRTRVKICGFTTIDEAVYAAHLGVDAIGLVFYPPSPRNISIKQAIKIVAALPAFISVVALFVDESETIIKQVLKQVAIDVIQFHGSESSQACCLYRKPYIKALSMDKTMDVNLVAMHYQKASALLLDTYHPHAKGGTGERFDWNLIPQSCTLPIILAGGLTPENAGLAITQVNPYALDVSSGVEIKKGIKDLVKIRTFISAVNQSDQKL